MTAWWNWAGWIMVVPGVQQGTTNFLISALQIQYPNNTVITKGWFSWIITSVGLIFATLPNIINPRILQIYFRFAILNFFILFFLFWIWFPVRASDSEHHFNTNYGVFGLFYNGINLGEEKQASDAYCWTISVLFGAWIFYGYDASAHLVRGLPPDYLPTRLTPSLRPKRPCKHRPSSPKVSTLPPSQVGFSQSLSSSSSSSASKTSTP